MNTHTALASSAVYRPGSVKLQYEYAVNATQAAGTRLEAAGRLRPRLCA